MSFLVLVRPFGLSNPSNEVLTQLLMYVNKDFPGEINRNILELALHFIHEFGRSQESQGSQGPRVRFLQLTLIMTPYLVSFSRISEGCDVSPGTYCSLKFDVIWQFCFEEPLQLWDIRGCHISDLIFI